MVRHYQQARLNAMFSIFLKNFKNKACQSLAFRQFVYKIEMYGFCVKDECGNCFSMFLML